MWTRLLNFFKSPVFDKDSEKTRRAEILHYGSIVIFIFLLLIFLINLAIGTQGAPSISWLLLLVALLQILIRWMIRAGYVNAASFILLTIGWGGITEISRHVDGIHDQAIFGYVLVILSSGYLLGWRASTVYTLASIASMWWLASLEKNGLIAPDIDNPFLTALYLTVIFILIFLIVYFLVKTLMQALEQAQRELSERKHIQDELQRLARTDPLTGLFNRRYFFEIAEKEFAKASRYDRPLSVAILDLDLFKDVNDTYGHLVGDQALIHIGKLLQEAIRAPDAVARYGGEEFVVLIPETECVNAMLFAERLRKLVEDSPIQNGRGTIYLTISLGVAGKQDKNEETFDQLISKADQALYKAKEGGRNRVVCHREDDENLIP